MNLRRINKSDMKLSSEIFVKSYHKYKERNMQRKEIAYFVWEWEILEIKRQIENEFIEKQMVFFLIYPFLFQNFVENKSIS